MRPRLGLGCLIGGLLCLPVEAPAQSPRTLEVVLAEVEKLGQVDFEMKRRSEPGYLDEFRRKQRDLGRKKAGLLLEACRLAPGDARVAEWMPERWRSMGWNQDPPSVAEEILADIDKYLPEFSQPKTVQEAEYQRALYRAHQRKPDAKAMYEAVCRFTSASPTDLRGAPLLQIVADATVGNDELLRTIYGRIGAEYPNTQQGKFAAGKLRRIAELGKPFELTFDDAVTGKRVSMADFRGKVVLVNFWATTCLPCIEETPRLAELYARFRERGVEFVGVSMDAPVEKGGLQSLRNFVSKRGLSWGQYYQGNGHDSDFSKSWGVGTTPTKFLVDQGGRLVGVIGSDEVESRINALLAR